MQIVLNDSTNTIHKRSDDSCSRHAECGALRHVSTDQLRSTTSENVRTREGIDRCGRCFRDAGGY